MLATNLKILSVVLGTILFYTYLAGSIPQVESEVPAELDLSANVTAEELVAAGEELYAGGGGCLACHGTGTRAPNLLEPDGATGLIGERCGQRVEGMVCKEYLHASLIRPTDFVVPGFDPIMPDMSRTLSESQVWTLVAYLESLGGEVTVSSEDLAASAADPAGGATAGSAAPASTTMEPMALLEENQCLVCHQLGDQGAPIGPPFTDVGARRDVDFIRSKVLDPASVQPAEGYEALAGTMPTTFGTQLSAAQLEVIVQFLAEQR
ncbi:MAG: c-type cytochrome [Gemmatimonas sp.]|nr:c-type cytochrome [Gemmatimonas sp.]